MAKRPGKQIAEATAEPLTKGGEAAEKIVRGNAEARTASGNASRAAIQELTKAYQELATKHGCTVRPDPVAPGRGRGLRLGRDGRVAGGRARDRTAREPD